MVRCTKPDCGKVLDCGGPIFCPDCGWIMNEYVRVAVPAKKKHDLEKVEESKE